MRDPAANLMGHYNINYINYIKYLIINKYATMGTPRRRVEKGVLGMPAHHLWMVPKHSRGANNMKNCEKLSENRNLIEITHLLMVLGMPDHHPTLPV